MRCWTSHGRKPPGGYPRQEIRVCYKYLPILLHRSHEIASHIFTGHFFLIYFRWVTVNDVLAYEEPCFFCATCFKGLHYSHSGEKICDFQAYPVVGDFDWWFNVRTCSKWKSTQRKRHTKHNWKSQLENVHPYLWSLANEEQNPRTISVDGQYFVRGISLWRHKTT